MAVNLSADLLRAFVTVADLASYTKAGDVLGRTQPAISLQIRRLEELVGVRLIETVGKRPQMTEGGEVLSVYARQILSLNDEVVGRYTKREKSRTLRVGLPTDYAAAFLQKMMLTFAEIHPEIKFEIHCDSSAALLDWLRKDDLDIVIAMTSEHSAQFLARAWVERPIWVSAEDWKDNGNEAVPLVSHLDGCEYRVRMIEALNSRQREWRNAYRSPGIAAVQNAVLSGLGVSALTQRTFIKGMRILSEDEGFPALASIRVGLYYKHPRQNARGVTMVNYLTAGLDNAGDEDFKRLI
jgi:DNA-binding transcriptional LysR family regulator